MTALADLIGWYLLNLIWQPVALLLLCQLVLRTKLIASAAAKHALWKFVCVASTVLPLGVILGLWENRPVVSTTLPANESAFAVPSFCIWGLITLAVSFACFRSLALAREWQRVRLLLRRAAPVQLLDLPLSSLNVYVTADEDAHLGPLLVGFLRPVILIPNALLQPANAHVLAAVISHEYGHIQRKDWLWMVVTQISLLPMSFHPMVGVFARRLAETRELACDEFVVERLVPRLKYAQSLLDVARLMMPRATAPGLALGITDGCLMETRIESLLGEERPTRLSSQVGFVCAAAAILVAIAFASSGRTLYVWFHPQPSVDMRSLLVAPRVPPPPPRPPGGRHFRE